jgi:hypothetical protein
MDGPSRSFDTKLIDHNENTTLADGASDTEAKFPGERR